jgi:hypothetical protein
MLCVENERFEIGSHQAAQLTLYAGLLAAAGAALDIAAVAARGHVPGRVSEWGIGLTIGGVIALWARTAYARAYTELSADGIRTRGIFGTRRAAWADVKDISVVDSKGNGVYSVKVLLRSGRGFRLGAPVHSPVMADPAFNRKVELLMAARQRARYGTAPGGGMVPDWGAPAPGGRPPGI